MIYQWKCSNERAQRYRIYYNFTQQMALSAHVQCQWITLTLRLILIYAPYLLCK